MSKKTLKSDNIKLNQNKFYVFKQPIALNLVNVNQIVVSDKLNIVTKVLNILLATKLIISLDHYISFYLK